MQGKGGGIEAEPVRSQGAKWWVRTENGMTRQWAVEKLKEVKEESVKTESEDRIKA